MVAYSGPTVASAHAHADLSTAVDGVSDDLLAHLGTEHQPTPRHPLFTPATVGGRYNGNGRNGTTTRTTGTALDQLIAGGPLYSGAEGVTLDQFDVTITTLGAAGAVYRIGVWTIDDQADPFAVVLAAQWATLLADLGTVDATTAGNKFITPGAAIVVPPDTWFAVGGVSQVAVCQPTIGMAAARFAPSGQALAVVGVVSTDSWVAQAGVNGVLGNLVPSSLINIGHGVGFRRSA